MDCYLPRKKSIWRADCLAWHRRAGEQSDGIPQTPANLSRCNGTPPAHRPRLPPHVSGLRQRPCCPLGPSLTTHNIYQAHFGRDGPGQGPGCVTPHSTLLLTPVTPTLGPCTASAARRGGNPLALGGADGDSRAGSPALAKGRGRGGGVSHPTC